MIASQNFNVRRPEELLSAVSEPKCGSSDWSWLSIRTETLEIAFACMTSPQSMHKFQSVIGIVSIIVVIIPGLVVPVFNG